MIAISMLEVKATVFSMSDVWQEIQFKRTKSLANWWSFRKTWENLSWHFNAQTPWHFNAQTWYNGFFTFILFLTFHEASETNEGYLSWHFNAPTVIKSFHLTLIVWNEQEKLNLFLTFHEALTKKHRRNISWYLNAQTVIQCFLLALILFLTRKNVRNLSWHSYRKKICQSNQQFVWHRWCFALWGATRALRVNVIYQTSLRQGLLAVLRAFYLKSEDIRRYRRSLCADFFS